MTKDTSHLDALELSASHERARLAAATNPKEIAHRKVWVAQYEKEIAAEKAFLGIEECTMSDEEILKELGL